MLVVYYTINLKDIAMKEGRLAICVQESRCLVKTGTQGQCIARSGASPLKPAESAVQVAALTTLQLSTKVLAEDKQKAYQIRVVPRWRIPLVPAEMQLTRVFLYIRIGDIGRAEIRNQRPETRNRKSRNRRSEAGSQKPETRGQRPETEEQRPDLGLCEVEFRVISSLRFFNL